MPSLEIICIGQGEPSEFSLMPFTVEAKKELLSHRSPAPLFQADFDKLEGCIYHLLDQGDVTAYDLLKKAWYDDESDFNIEFKDEYAPSVKEMLEYLITQSPVHQILFTSDYQFGPETVEKYGPLSFSEFWKQHQSGQLTMNASYLIVST